MDPQMPEEVLSLFKELAAVSVAAGREIMDIYSENIDFELKDDDSPITAADRRAHEVILRRLSDMEYRGAVLPVLSEEGRDIPAEERKSWKRYWLVDPLDGTKEFISRNDEFTVNIALIEGRYPKFGIVYLPVTGDLYYGGAEYGSWKTKAEDTGLSMARRLPFRTDRDNGVLVAAGSRSHRSGEFDSWVQEKAEKEGYRGFEVITAGSSLKFCLVAEGAADVYPRFGPTMEWDIAAAQAIAEGAGKSCVSAEEGVRMMYNKELLKNASFIVS